MLKEMIISLMVASSILIPSNSVNINFNKSNTINTTNLEFVDKPIVGMQTKEEIRNEKSKGFFLNLTENEKVTKEYNSVVTDEQIDRLKENGYIIKIVKGIQDTGNWGFNPVGLHDPNKRIITIDEGYFSYAFNHEYGHFIDYINNSLSSSNEFSAIYECEKDSLFPDVQEPTNNDFYKKTKIEYFAEAYKIYVENPNKLQTKAMKTYNFINNIEKLYEQEYKDM